ncbi:MULTISPECIES: methylated-DNA--[protein]-cysteine S-methyltransferase [unclassified Arthrobacter]|uniref:methylated-DNA--[protein]-cysteine S-methyltransferase n=1 Tax=unclassified Arthrobacter TaxID=235627 RepID=UPI001490FE67|nr:MULTISPECIES: methylated-DNA--[protein]-cysteine S-methyltransferase [unclassified Arthrobacter]MBE0010173.1 methylated-DNA--[protein]-cysteine S-methyltransferase [Arthrobacter sp. AET 35A]NOJ63989.1 methylated-DNA--[protein]-cysteine S-methyltransferase [Arthrobacter sp. 147(2020)]
MKSHRFMATPVGKLLIVVERASLTAVYHEVHNPPPIPSAVGVAFAKLSKVAEAAGETPTAASLEADAGTFDRAQAQFHEYFAGKRRAFSLPVQPNGTDFQHRVWAAVLAVPYGETRSYKELAAQLGNPLMGRAIGAAIRVNPLAIIIPGHRVVSSSGGVTGYSAGPAVKRLLLDLEAGDAVRPAA